MLLVLFFKVFFNCFFYNFLLFFILFYFLLFILCFCLFSYSCVFLFFVLKKHVFYFSFYFLIFLLFLFFTLFVFSIQAQDTANIGDLKKIYQNNCAKCHGADGSATGEDGQKLKGEDFTNQKWLNGTKDDKMIKIILDGKFFGLAMPAYKEILTKEDAQLMVTEIIRKSKKGEIIKPE